ncbi:MAG: hypothetical protein ACRDPK_05385 [Carbonactinosporaceae bacterium]
MRLRVLMEPRNGGTYEQVLALAQATESAGFDAFLRSDHYLGVDPGNPAYQPTDSWTTLAGQGAVFGAANPPYDIPRLLGLFRTGDLNLKDLITRRYSLEEINEGYRDLLDGKDVRDLIIHEHDS